MAELVKLPVESAELGAILAELPQDDKWDLEIPLERGYSKAGLVRYHLEGVKALTSTKAEESYSEQLSQSKQGAVQKVAGGPKLELENVKAENQLHDKLQAKIQVAESGRELWKRSTASLRMFAWSFMPSFLSTQPSRPSSMRWRPCAATWAIRSKM